MEAVTVRTVHLRSKAEPGVKVTIELSGVAEETQAEKEFVKVLMGKYLEEALKAGGMEDGQYE